MKRKALAILIAVMTISLSACGGESGNAGNAKEIEELEEKIEKLEKENRELRKQLSGEEETEEQKGTDEEQNKTSTNRPDGFVAETSGICGENLTWEYGNGIIYIQGKGEMTNYDLYDFPAPWTDIKGKIAKVIVEKGCTSIGTYAFSKCNSLSGVEIANSVTEIGEGAFSNCTNLKSFVFPKNLKKVYSWCISGCTAMERITLPDALEEFEEILSIKGHGDSAATATTSMTYTQMLDSMYENHRITSQQKQEFLQKIENSAESAKKAYINPWVWGFADFEEVTWKGVIYSSSDAQALVDDLMNAGILNWDEQFAIIDEWKNKEIGIVEEYIKDNYTIVD
ncbi:MAG: leucine-rich repeat domain-containing protein [Acetatifactor sp.]|nr:leucine-rich repeat domain-containing protein [Acetatifactor sp.]